ncbi:MAG: DUF2786 domain-containing protein [Acidimicrobiales bacterium]|jgi:hypothetical protein
MATKHRSRRQAKARRHGNGQRITSPGSRSINSPWPSSPEQVDALIVEAAHADCEGHDPSPLIAALAGPDEPHPGQRELVSDRLTAALTVNATLAMHRGWEPLDLSKASRRLTNATAAGFIEGVLAEAVRRRRPPTWAHQRWESQLDDLAGGARRLRATAQSWHTDVGSAVWAVSALVHLRPLPELVPARRRVGSGPRPGIDPGLLAKVRALLAKAEATGFEEEAEAFLAKAQELMARNNLDRAALEGMSEGGEPDVEALRCWLDDPYRKEKSYLAHVVASANRCRAIADHELGMSTIFGHPDDLDAFEVLFTALLVHASKHMRLPLRKAGSLEAERSKRPSYRRSFLIAYADRIGARLREASEAATRAAVEEAGRSLLPVLASREEHVEGAVHKSFPKLSETRFSVRDYEGWNAGRAAADLADLSARPRLAGRG